MCFQTSSNPPENQESSTAKSSALFWTERRIWWQAVKEREGTDWVGIARTIVQVDEFIRRSS
jgi:hypothetical protein